MFYIISFAYTCKWLIFFITECEKNNKMLIGINCLRKPLVVPSMQQNTYQIHLEILQMMPLKFKQTLGQYFRQILSAGD